jgi:hypothetical protein
MKKMAIVGGMILLTLVGLANAQTMTYTGKLQNPDRTGPMMASNTYQIGKTLKTTVEQIGGGLAHFDMTVDTSSGDAVPISLDMYDRYGQHVYACPSLVLIGTESTSQAQIYTDTFKMIATCVFTPDGEGGDQGIGYMTLAGTSTSNHTGSPLKLTLTGTVGGGVYGAVNTFVAKGTFGSVLKPPLQ